MKKQPDENFPEEVVVQRREAALKRMLATPPAPFTPKKKPSPKKGKAKKA
jgi:hypothetical protein